MTKAEAIEYLNKIPEDEPVFVLRAQDKTATHVVFMWAACAELAGAPEVKVDGACRQAVHMSQWQEKNRDKVKVPD
jgi:hypothetical protein